MNTAALCPGPQETVDAASKPGVGPVEQRVARKGQPKVAVVTAAGTIVQGPVPPTGPGANQQVACAHSCYTPESLSYSYAHASTHNTHTHTHTHTHTYAEHTCAHLHCPLPPRPSPALHHSNFHMNGYSPPPRQVIDATKLSAQLNQLLEDPDGARGQQGVTNN